MGIGIASESLPADLSEELHTTEGCCVHYGCGAWHGASSLESTLNSPGNLQHILAKDTKQEMS